MLRQAVNKMSLQDQLNSKNRELKKVETIVTCIDGRKYTESGRGLVCKRVEQDLGEREAFYVIDSAIDDFAHEVVPGLFIGSQEVASNFLELEKHSIKSILNVAVGVLPVSYEKIECKLLPIYDLPDFDIKAHFEEALGFITRSIQQGAVLVHCNAGISRSTTIIAAFLVREKRMALNEALTLIKAARPVARPNEGFMRQLRLYEKEILCLSE